MYFKKIVLFWSNIGIFCAKYVINWANIVVFGRGKKSYLGQIQWRLGRYSCIKKNMEVFFSPTVVSGAQTGQIMRYFGLNFLCIFWSNTVVFDAITVTIGPNTVIFGA